MSTIIALPMRQLWYLGVNLQSQRAGSITKMEFGVKDVEIRFFYLIMAVWP